jgi:uncharacterized protein YkwD
MYLLLKPGVQSAVKRFMNLMSSSDARRRVHPVRRSAIVVLAVVAAFLTGSAARASAGTRATAPVLDAEESAFCRTINSYRVQQGLVPLKVSISLSKAAKWDTTDMAQKNYFSHTDSVGRDPFKRMAAFGYTFSTAEGENIAAGNATAANTFAQWKASAPHNTNMLNSGYKVIGISRSYSATATYGWYWTTDFGGYPDQSVACPTS